MFPAKLLAKLADSTNAIIFKICEGRPACLLLESVDKPERI